MMRREWMKRRDRYQIGDWFLDNGIPRQWTIDDYSRDYDMMESVDDIEIASDFLERNAFYMRDDICCYENDDVDEFSSIVRIHYDEREYVWLADIDSGSAYVENFPLIYVCEFQRLLRSFYLYDFAECLKIGDDE